MHARSRLLSFALATAMLGVVPVVVSAPQAQALQPVPGHTRLVPEVPRTDQPKISNGEIWDIAVIGNNVYVAGSFTSITPVGGSAVSQRYLASYNYSTGAFNTAFRPVFNSGINAVEASPDGTKLFVGGTFSTVNGASASKIASISPTTGALVTGFNTTRVTNNAVTAIAATNSTVYVGGKFTQINGVARAGLAAMAATTGVVDTGFNLPLTGGIGVNGALTVQQLKLTHDETKLLVVHTGRQIAGQDRLGIGWIDTATKTLLPWRTRLWDDYLPLVGGITRIYAGDIAPNDQYFVVTSGSGGDRPPISDVAIAFPVAGGDNMQPLWVSRHFDSVYSVAITEKAVYVGGHFQFEESPTANQPWPGLDNVGYGTGQGLSGYGLGDQVVRRDHLSALDPATGTAIEWDPGSNSFEGNKAMLATSRGLFAGGDAGVQGGKSVGRIAFFDLNSIPAPTPVDTAITTPIEGRVVQSGVPFTMTGTATSTNGVRRVQLEIQDRNTKRWLQPDGVTWGTTETNVLATLASPNATSTTWSRTFTLTGNNPYTIFAKAFGVTGSDPTKASKRIESFGLTDQTPTTAITGPGGIVPSTTFHVTGTATDDIGVNRISLWFRDENNQYLQDDGSVGSLFNTFSIAPDVPGAPNATWSYDVTVPHEGTWRGSATAVDTIGQSDLRSDTRDWIVSSTALAPTVTITSPVAVTPPLTVPAVQLTPGGQLTFAGTANDDGTLDTVQVSLRNSSTHEALAADGSWGVNAIAGSYRISPIHINASSYNWTYTTPFTLTPGQYSFSVSATDTLGLTSTSGRLTLNVQAAGDAFPNGLLNFTGTDQTPETLHLDIPGTATDDIGVSAVRVSVFENQSGRYLQSNGTLSNGFATLPATLVSPGAPSTAFTFSVDLPSAGDYSIAAYATDTSGQTDPSTSGATARYLVFPGDADPTFDPTLGSPTTGTTFTNGRIVVSGRANDDISIARVDVAIVNSLGQYMSSTGTFTSTTASFRAAFLNSPGSQGSNFAYTSPVIPPGVYSVQTRATDGNGQTDVPQVVTNITVTQPSNLPPVANATVSCAANVCTFDGRSSTDENVPALSYSWNFGNGTTGTGPVPIRTYTGPGTFTVVLTVKDEWGATGTFTMAPLTIVEPAGNVAPTPTFVTSCPSLTCSVSSSGTVDPNVGDVITYVWSWGDGTPTTTGSSSSHVYATTGTYVVTMTATDGWGKSATTTRTVNLVEPAGNLPPVPTFTATCVARVCQMNSSGTVDPNGDVIAYSWNFGDLTAAVTGATPSHTFVAAGTYTITLTTTDGWNRSASTTRQVTLA